MIKKANHTHIDSIYLLIDANAKNTKLLPRSKEEIAEVIDSFYIFIKDNKVIGCCALEIYNKKLAEIRSLAVTSEHRNKGIAQKLIKVCVTEAKKKNVYKILVVTDRVNLFERQGFANCLNNQTALFLKYGNK